MELSTVNIEELSPVMRQYAEIKGRYEKHLVLFRLGEFYELFFQDAVIASRLLDIILTGREGGLEQRVPMCGIPANNADMYVKKLVECGYRIAVCEQLTEPAQSKGLVERDVVKIITPGMLIGHGMIDDGRNNYICCIHYSGKECGMCFADISTGEMDVCVKKGKRVENAVINELTRFTPSEVIFNADFLDLKASGNFMKDVLGCTVTLRDDACFDVRKNKGLMTQSIPSEKMESMGFEYGKSETACICGLLDYINETQRMLPHSIEVNFFQDGDYMELDLTARRNLELTGTIRDGGKKGSLLGVIDMTKTPMGKRLIRSWLEKPLNAPVKIMERLEAVKVLCANSVTLWNIDSVLKNVRDIERLMTRVLYKSASPLDLKALSETAMQMPALKELLSGLTESKLLARLSEQISSLDDISSLIENAIKDEPAKNIRDGGFIKEGFNEELDRLRGIETGGNNLIAEILKHERERTGIKNLKTGYNRVFGYYLEVTRSYYESVPEDYIRKQTLTNCERFITEDLKKAEYDITSAQQRILTLEAEIFAEIRDFIAAQLITAEKTAKAAAETDVLCSFAAVSIKNQYVQPEIAIDGITEIKNGRHPVVEVLQNDEMFVPNDAYLDTGRNRMSIITGPNMSGKSTYMRQIAIMTVMAQTGCFVPASYAKISLVDRIFTRVGASVDLASGRSTFMVEMSEVAEIL
ncbi:MAG: DNA mismatch repair protein MutS, partial [Oscillospiraceae bacterium]|nr:DNA mismatch repair protein MutS [Oscillospiraceae bacterium]